MANQDNATDFAIWGKLDVWTLDQAAYLCCGLEPRSDYERKTNKEAIPERVRAIAQRLQTEIRPLKTAPAPVITAPRTLRRIRAETPPARKSSTPRFRRVKVEAWAEQAGIRLPHLGAGSQRGRWPWGEYETWRYRIMAEATEKFWVRYAPGEPESAPGNEQVVKWLRDKGISSETMANSMATIMRADDAPKGRRSE